MEQKTDDLKTLVKYGKIDLILKIIMLVGGGIGGYIGYNYATQKSEEFQQTMTAYKKKLAKIPLFGSPFKEG